MTARPKPSDRALVATRDLVQRGLKHFGDGDDIGAILVAEIGAAWDRGHAARSPADRAPFDDEPTPVVNVWESEREALKESQRTTVRREGLPHGVGREPRKPKR